MKKNKSNCTSINDLLSKIFEKREEEIYEFEENERELLSKKSNDYSNIYIAINNVPNAFTETRKGIEESIETYLETLNNIQGIENKKFYKEGFRDAISLLINCLYEGNKTDL